MFSGYCLLAVMTLRGAETEEFREIQVAGPDWVSYSLDWRNPAEPVWDFSIATDAPAGKHGKVKVNGENFVFENGARFRMWGVNISAAGCFPAKEDAPRIASFLARWGFNAVRLSHLDPAWSDGVIDYKHKEALRLRPERLDLLFYFLSELRKQGIYYVMDGYHDFDIHTWPFQDLGPLRKSKFLLNFYLPVRQYHEEYLTKLFTTVNPYTGVSIAEDPALAGVQMVNETFLNRSLRDFDRLDKFPPKVREEFASVWLNWSQKNRITVPYDLITETLRMRFFSDLERDYFKSSYRFYREKLGVKAPIASSSCYVGAFTMPSSYEGDYSEGHAYYGHPVRENVNGKSMMKLAEPGYLGNYGDILPFILQQRIGYRPYVLGEWNACNPERFDLPLLISAVAGIQNFNGVFLFNLIQSPWEKTSERNIGTFISLENPSVMVNMIPAALAFHGKMIPAAEQAMGIVIPEQTLFPGDDTGSFATAPGLKIIDAEGRDIPVTAGNYSPRVFGENQFWFRLFALPQFSGAGNLPENRNLLLLPFSEDSSRIYPESVRRAKQKNPVKIFNDKGLINTPMFIAMWGRLGGEPHSSGVLTVKAPENSEFSVSMVTLDHQVLTDSKRILIAVGPISSPRQLVLLEKFDSNGKRTGRYIEKLSEKEPMAKPVVAEISVSNGAFKLFRVGNNGQKLNELRCTVEGNCTTWHTDPTDPVWFYLLERQ